MKLEMKLPCPKNEAIESYEILLAVCRAEDAYLAVGYKQMRDLLERICRGQMQNESLPAAYFPVNFKCYPEPSTRAQPRTTLAGCENSGFLYP